MPEMPFNCPRPPSPRLTSPPSHSSRVSSKWRWALLRLAVPAIMSVITAGKMASLRAQQPTAAAQQSGEEILPGGVRIHEKFINFDQERIQLTVAYRRAHQDAKAGDIIIQPRMIV